MKGNPEGSNFLSKLTNEVQALKEIKVPLKIQSKTGKVPYNTTIDYGNFKHHPVKKILS